MSEIEFQGTDHKEAQSNYKRVMCEHRIPFGNSGAPTLCSSWPNKPLNLLGFLLPSKKDLGPIDA